MYEYDHQYKENIIDDNQNEISKKQQLKKVSGIIGKMMLLVMVGQTVLVILLSNIISTNFLNKGSSETFGLAFLNDVSFWNYVLNITLSLIMNIVPAIIVLNVLGYSFKDMFKLPNMKPVKIIRTTFETLGITFLCITPVASLIISLISGAGGEITSPDFSVPKETLMAQILYVVMLVVVAPITEEIFYRGLIQRSLMPFGKGFAIVISSLIFAVIHGNFMQTPNAFFMGLLLGYAAMKTNSIVLPIILHFANNSIALLSTYATTYNAQWMYSLLSFIMIVSMIFGAIKIVSVIGSILKNKKVKSLDTASEYNEKPILKSINPYKVFFSSPAVIIYSIIITYQLFQSVIFVFN